MGMSVFWAGGEFWAGRLIWAGGCQWGKLLGSVVLGGVRRKAGRVFHVEEVLGCDLRFGRGSMVLGGGGTQLFWASASATEQDAVPSPPRSARQRYVGRTNMKTKKNRQNLNFLGTTLHPL